MYHWHWKSRDIRFAGEKLEKSLYIFGAPLSLFLLITCKEADDDYDGDADTENIIMAGGSTHQFQE